VQSQPNIRLLHAQLVVPIERFVDESGAEFKIEPKLKARGLSIYVFEDQDAEQMINDEGGRVKQAIEDSEYGREVEREVVLDIGHKKTTLERNVERARMGKGQIDWGDDEFEETTDALGCKCVHGKCG